MNIAGFSTESLKSVTDLLNFAQSQPNPLEGQCNQKKKREAMKQNRTPAQQAADRLRSQQQRGKNQTSSATRSEAAKKAAETRKRCKKGGSTTGPTSP